MSIACYLLFLHFIADFVLQSSSMAKGKSENFGILFQHISVHLFIFMIGLSPFLSGSQLIAFAWGNMLLHGLIDWNVWRMYKRSVLWRYKKQYKNQPDITPPSDKNLIRIIIKQWKFWEDHWFWVTLGFDQLLHGLTLMWLFQYVTRF